MSIMNTLSVLGKFGVADYTLETSGISVTSYDTGALVVSVDGACKQVISVATGIITGGSGNDFIASPRGGVSLFGGAGDDVLEAAGDKSLLSGGPGQDVLIAGGRGATLVGDAPSVVWSPSGKINFYPDVFVITSAEASPLFDPVTIADFDSWGGDRIDLSAIDGDVESVGHQELLFSQNGPQPHSVWYEASGYGAASAKGYLRGDVSGDGEEDFLVTVEHIGADLFGNAVSSAWVLGLGTPVEAKRVERGSLSDNGISFPRDEGAKAPLPGLSSANPDSSLDLL